MVVLLCSRNVDVVVGGGKAQCLSTLPFDWKLIYCIHYLSNEQLYQSLGEYTLGPHFCINSINS